MELKLSVTGCKCKTLFHGTGRGRNFSKQLLKLGKYIDKYAPSTLTETVYAYLFIPNEPKCVLSDGDHTALLQLLVNGARANGIDLARKLNANMKESKRLLDTDVDIFHESVVGLAIRLYLDTDIVNELLIHGADPCKANSNGLTPLHRAMFKRNMAIVVQKLLTLGADPNAECNSGFTPLHLTVMHNDDARIVQKLIKYGADANKELSRSSGTPLAQAICFGRGVRVISELIKGGAIVDGSNVPDPTPLTLAAIHCRSSKVIEELFKHRSGSVDSESRNLLLNHAIHNVEFAKPLFKYTLITSEGDYYTLFDLNPYKEFSNYAILSHYLEDCVREIVQMKTMKIRNNLSLLMFVTMKNTTNALYANTEDTKSITVEENLIANYPIYGDMIAPKVKYALERATLLNKLEEVHVYNNWHCSPETVEEKEVLSLDSTYVVAKFLSNRDLHNFIIAYHAPSNCCATGLEEKSEKDFSTLQQTVATKK